MNLLSLELEAVSPARYFPANWEPTLDEILAEPIIRQVMASDGVTEPTLRRLASEIGESHIASGDDRAEVRFYSDHLLPVLQSTLASRPISISATRSSATTWNSGPDRVRRSGVS